MLIEATDDFRGAARNVDELGQYRSLSTLAVAAFLLGLGSVVAFAAQPLVVVPLTAVAVALLALSKIRSSAGALTGSWLARAGLALAILFAVGAFSRVYVRNNLSVGLADSAARKWLAAVSEGRIEEALEMMSRTALMRLRPPPAGRTAPPAPFDQQVAIDMLQEDPLLHALEPATDASEVQFQSTAGMFQWTTRDPEVGCMFEATGTHVEPVEFRLVLKRRVSPANDVVWLVDSWLLINPTAEQLHALHRH